MKHKQRSFEVILTREEVNEIAALTVIMKSIDLIRVKKVTGEEKDERCKAKRKS